ncbi:unnamed protein product, partial [marine sediment metagenome]
ECLVKCVPLTHQYRMQTKVERIIQELEDLSGRLETTKQKQAIEDTIKILKILASLSEL